MATFNATLTSLTEAFVFAGDNSQIRFGNSVSGARDVNGDGFDDVIVGAPYDNAGGTGVEVGSARVFSGLDGTELYKFEGDSFFDLFGDSVSGAGDVNGDGFDDLVVGIVGQISVASSALGARVFSGADGSILFDLDRSGDGDAFGTSVSGIGDINGDGFDEFIVGAPFSNNNGPDAGTAEVFSGADGSILFTVNGDINNDRLGTTVSGAGDLNGDGVGDFIVGVPRDDNNGGQSGSVRAFSGATGNVLFTVSGDHGGAYFGDSVSGAGDVNGDGFDDLIAGAPGGNANGFRAGNARVFSGKDGSVLFTFDGGNAGDYFGSSVSGAGDVNGDGFDDFLIGARSEDSNGTGSGTVRIFSGVDGSVLFTFDGNAGFEALGFSVSGAGDVNGDGFDDVILGAPGAGSVSIGSNHGAARLLTTTGTGRLDSVRTFIEGTAPVVLDGDVRIADVLLDALNGGNGNYGGAALNIQRQGGGNGNDLFAFAPMANVTVNGSDLEVAGNVIATFTTVAGVLNVLFTAMNGSIPTTGITNEIIQAVTYQSVTTTLDSGETAKFPLIWTFSDGTGNLVDTIDIAFTGTGGVVTGTNGDDLFLPSAANDSFDGLAGNDTIDFSASAAPVAVNLNQSVAQPTGGSGSDTIINTENLIGGAGNDRFVGSTGQNTLNGGAGDDQLFGIGGNDILNGGDGDDLEVGGAGADTINGQDGNDRLRGGNGDDDISGGAGRDIILGGDGNDFITGGPGRDLLFGGAGADVFIFDDPADTGLVFADRDIIRDFNKVEFDRIDVSSIDAVPGGANNSFTFLGTLAAPAFTNTPGELLAVNTAGGQTVVWGDIDGDGVQDFTIVLDGTLALNNNDFIL